MRTLLLIVALVPLAAQAECWKPVPSPKSLTFTASQAGAPFPGELKSYIASLCLDAKDASKSTLQVRADLNSVDTGLPEMDDALKGEDFFDTAHFAQATFTSDSLKPVGPGQYTVSGKLALHGVTRPVTVPFRFTPAADGKSARLEARFSLKRLDYGIGRGQWADTQWVADPVELAFAVTFVPANQ